MKLIEFDCIFTWVVSLDTKHCPSACFSVVASLVAIDKQDVSTSSFLVLQNTCLRLICLSSMTRRQSSQNIGAVSG